MRLSTIMLLEMRKEMFIINLIMSVLMSHF